MKVNFSSWLILSKFKREDAVDFIREFWRDSKLRWFVLSSLILNILLWMASMFINFRVRDDVIALHHNIYFGITLIGDPEKVYFIPFLGLIIIAVNLIFANIIKKEEKFFVYIFSASSLVVNLFLLLGIISIFLVNFR